MKQKWSRTPKHIMRRQCIEQVVKSWEPSNFIELGAGTGDLTLLFLEKGFYGKCYDLGEQNRDILRKNFAEYGKQVEIIDDLAALNELLFDYLFAFEVLEHIRNDAETLAYWSSHLKKKGKLLISVPAHMRKYGRDDEFVGHVRRYEKAELFRLLKETGYTNISILNYGYPLGNITRFVNNLLYDLRNIDEKKDNLSLEERSIRSGVERSKIVTKLSLLFNETLLLPFTTLQKIFYERDLGDGYVAHAEKL
jgi:SAM-dependent methyltransferase